MNKEKGLKELGLISSFAIYIPAAFLMYLLTRYLIPYLSQITGQETILFWFIVGGFCIFVPLIITGILILKAEGNEISKTTWIERLRFRRLTREDLIWFFIGLVVVGVISLLIMKALELIIGKFDSSPAFMLFDPLTKGRYWLLIVWLPYWILNIL
jgi:hypothetical protein